MSDSRSPRPRRKSSQQPLTSPHPIGTPSHGVSRNTGPLATAAWLVLHRLAPRESHWYVEVSIGTSEVPDEEAATMLRVEVFGEEWGFYFRHDGKVSWIRVTDVPFVHGRDEHRLLGDTPALRNIGTVMRSLEKRLELRFAVEAALVRTNLFEAEPTIREWLRTW